MTYQDPSQAPHDLSAEQALLGALLIDPTAIHGLDGVLAPSDFYRHAHRVTFATALTLRAQGTPLDIITLAEELERCGVLEDVGGMAYLGTIAQDTPGSANILAYAAIVTQRAQARRLLQSLGDATAALHALADPTTVAAEIMEKLAAMASADKSGVSVVCAADIQPERIDWLWPGWLAAGKVHVLAGAPGTGKTTLALALAAAITTAGKWPDGANAPQGDVLIWSGEDDPADTLVPRLLACGADLDRVHIISGVVDRDGRRSFDPAIDIYRLHEAARKIGRPIRLLHVDPIVSAVAGDSHKNAEVRRAMQPLVDLGQHLRAAVLGTTHFTKGTKGQDPVDRVTGSLAFGALARLVLVAAKCPDEGKREGVRMLARAKSNIGPDTSGYEYRLDLVEVPGIAGLQATRVTWGAAIKGSARELLRQADIGDTEEHSAE